LFTNKLDEELKKELLTIIKGWFYGVW
jgi:hypothetical protein